MCPEGKGSGTVTRASRLGSKEGSEEKANLNRGGRGRKLRPQSSALNPVSAFQLTLATLQKEKALFLAIITPLTQKRCNTVGRA